MAGAAATPAAAAAAADGAATSPPPASGSVTYRSLLDGYARLREVILARAPTASIAAFDAAVDRLASLPNDGTDFDLPAELPTASTQSAPPAVAASSSPLSPDPLLDSCGQVELRDAMDAHALRRIDAGKVDSLPRIRSRLFAVWRTIGIRARLIADLRPLNRSLPPPPHFTLPSVIDALPWASVRWATKTDLVSAFWTIRVSARLAAAMSVGDYEWRVLPFGYSWSPFIFHSLLEPLIEAMRALGFALVKYLDDILVADADRNRCAEGTALLRQFLTDLGFTVSVPKSSPEPEQELVFLGMGLNLRDRWFYWPADKAQRVIDTASDFLSSPSGVIRTRDLQSWLGRTVFLSTVCPLMASWRRSLESAVASSSDASTVRLTPAMRAELRFWVSSSAVAGCTFPWPTGDRWVVRTDASDTAGGVTVVWPGGRRSFSYSFLLPPEMRSASSGEREVYTSVTAIDTLVTAVGRRPLYRAIVDVYTDATASAGALTRGGHAPSMVPHTRRALALSRSLGATIRPHWLPRERLQREDDLSKRLDLHELRAHPDFVAFLCGVVGWSSGPAYDAFAASANRHASSFSSKVPEPGASLDGLSSPLIPRSWSYPPMQLAPRAARQCSSSRVPSLLVFTGDRQLQASLTLPGVVWSARVQADGVLLAPPLFRATIPPPTPLTIIAFHVDSPLRPGSYVLTRPPTGGFRLVRHHDS